MRSVADDLRDERLRDLQKLTAGQRIELALDLGRRDVEFYMAVQGVDRQTALRALRRVAQEGRVPSKSHDEL